MSLKKSFLEEAFVMFCDVNVLCPTLPAIVMIVFAFDVEEFVKALIMCVLGSIRVNLHQDNNNNKSEIA